MGPINLLAHFYDSGNRPCQASANIRCGGNTKRRQIPARKMGRAPRVCYWESGCGPAARGMADELVSINMKSISIGIIGFGRFGRVIHRLFEDVFEVWVSSSSYKDGDIEGVRFDSLENVVRTVDAVFLTVPINKTGQMAERIRPFLRKGQVVVDVCSVKELPNEAMKRALEGTGVAIWPTHPMFGPDSTQNGFEGLVWVSCQDELQPEVIAPYLDHLRRKGLVVVETTCSLHDRMAASSQGLTHFVGRILDELDIHPTDIDTLGYKRLLAVREQTCNDTWELFCDLQSFNRFTPYVHQALLDAIFKVHSRFLDSAATRSSFAIGILSSERDSAIRAWQQLVTQRDGDALRGESGRWVPFTDETDILKALTMGVLDEAVLRIQTDLGSPVMSAFEALGRYRFSPRGFVSVTGVGQFVIVSRRHWDDSDPAPTAAVQ